MDVSGERRLPAVRQVVWAALSDPATLADSLPPGLLVERLDGSGFVLAASDGSWRTRATPDPANGAAQSVLHLAPTPGPGHGVSGRADLTMAEDGVFTRLIWRVTADAPDDATPGLVGAVEHLLTHLGQRSATPEPVAADGLAGAAAAVAAAVPSRGAAATATRATVGQGPIEVVRRTVAAAPRDQLIGGAVFAVVVLFVIGAL